jgi:hypothetical protein
VCGAVCGVVCGICDFFCGIFGCDCGCKNVCNTVCNVVTDVVCAWTYVLETVLEYVTRLVCNYIIQAIIRLLHLIEAIVTMVLTWVCSLIDVFIRWLFCWTHLGDLFDSTRPRRFRVAPRIVPNDAGHSAWFVYVNNPDASGNVDQNALVYVLSDEGRPLLPLRDRDSGSVTFFEVETRGDFITGELRRSEGKDGEFVRGRPFLYYPHKVMEIASHLFGDSFATDPADDGTGTDFERNLFTYVPNVQAWLAHDGRLPDNQYNDWSGKYASPGNTDYFGDQTLPDLGLRVDTDATCSHPTNTFLHLVTGIEFAPPDTGIAEGMTCGAGQSLTFDETDYLMLNKENGTSVTTYFVSSYSASESSVGCNDLLGYTIVTFEGSGQPLFIGMRVLPYMADTNRMMSRIVENISASDIVRVAETYLHECGHQCGLLHDGDTPDCADDTTLHITKVMDPGGSVRRAFTRLQWCMVRNSWYVTSASLTPFTQAPELPDSGSVPVPPVP